MWGISMLDAAKLCRNVDQQNTALASATVLPATFALDTMKHNHINYDPPTVPHQVATCHNMTTT
jgi:hypothetical protein